MLVISDDRAHNQRYDEVLKSLEYFDKALRTLWTFLQNSVKYQDTTTLVIIWAAVIGPGSPSKGEQEGCPLRRLRALLGIDPSSYPGIEGALIPEVIA